MGSLSSKVTWWPIVKCSVSFKAQQQELCLEQLSADDGRVLLQNPKSLFSAIEAGSDILCGSVELKSLYLI